MRSFFLSVVALLGATSLYAQTVTVGTDTTSTSSWQSSSPYSQFYMSHRVQLMYTAEELLAGGAPAGGGFITSLAFDCTTTTLYPLPEWTIKIANTSQPSLTTSYAGPLSTVLAIDSLQPVAGTWNVHNLMAPFWWNGSDNLVVDVCNGVSESFSHAGQTRYSTTDSVMCRYQYQDGSSVCDDNLIHFNMQRTNVKLTFGPLNVSLLTGSVYHDTNQNHQRDIGESGIAGQKIQYPWEAYTNYVFTDADGNYQFYSLTGTYQLSHMINPIVQGGWFSSNSGGNSLTAVIDSAGATYGGYDFGVYIDTAYNDVGVDMSCSNPHPGFPSTDVITVYNATPAGANVTLHWYYDTMLTYVGSNVTPDVADTVNRVLTYNLVLAPGTSTNIDISMYCAVGPAAGTPVYNQASVTLNGNEDLYALNDSTRCQATVFAAYDPNDKQVNPAGVGDLHSIPANDQTELVYTVRFQNTGNFMATNVTLVDTLDVSRLNAASLRWISNSHPCDVEMLDGRVLKIHFDGIMLPDSNANEPASHGYFTFGIRLLPGLTVGTTIYNNAAIYFDFNEPIVTNTSFVTLDQNVSVYNPIAIEEYELYPNPADQSFRLNRVGNAERNATYFITDVLGRTLHTGNINSPAATVYTSGLINGVYHFMIVNGDGSSTTKRFTVLHP